MIREALQRLGRRGLTRLAGASRAAKFRHLLDDTLRLPAAEQAVLAVLALRGPQTPGELRQRTERLYRLADAAALQAALDGLGERGLAVRLARMPGQKEERYLHLLSADADEVPVAPAAVPAAVPAAAPPPAAVPAAYRRPPSAWRTTTGWSGWSAGSRRWRPSWRTCARSSAASSPPGPARARSTRCPARGPARWTSAPRRAPSRCPARRRRRPARPPCRARGPPGPSP